METSLLSTIMRDCLQAVIMLGALSSALTSCVRHKLPAADSAGRRPAGESPGFTAADTMRNPFSRSLERLPDVDCVASDVQSEPLPFAPVSLGDRYDNGDLLPGPAARLVVLDSTEWPGVWRQLADTFPLPPVAFNNDALIVAATATSMRGQTELTVRAIRQCRINGHVVVALQIISRGPVLTDAPSRGLAAARVSRSALSNASVLFVMLPYSSR